MKEIDLLRKEIDLVDEELVRLFERRLELVDRIGREKKALGLPVKNGERERVVIDRARGLCKEENKDDLERFIKGVISLCTDRQENL